MITATTWQDLPRSQTYPASNGACLFAGQLLVCDQGYQRDSPSQLVLVKPNAPYAATPLLNNFHGRPFNSLNDVVVLSLPSQTHRRTIHSALLGTRREGDAYETIWFTDPPYGHEQGFKPAPQLPPQVYCFDPWTGNVKAVADGFVKPNGIAFSAKGTTCYITDTGMISGGGCIDGSLPGTM